MIAAAVHFVVSLVGRRPETIGLLEEHLEEQEGLILRHILIADLHRWCESEYLSGRTGPTSPLMGVLGDIEEAFDEESGDEDVCGLIAVSFLEHMAFPPDTAAGLRDLVGPRCRQFLNDHYGGVE